MKLQLSDLKSYKIPTSQMPTLIYLSEKFKSAKETTTTKIQNIRQELSLLPPRERNILYGTTALGIVASGLSIYALIQKTTQQPVVLTGQPIVLGEDLNITNNQTSDPLKLADSTELDLMFPLLGIVGTIVVLTAGYFACCNNKNSKSNRISPFFLENDTQFSRNELHERKQKNNNTTYADTHPLSDAKKKAKRIDALNNLLSNSRQYQALPADVKQSTTSRKQLEDDPQFFMAWESSILQMTGTSASELSQLLLTQ